MQLEHHRNKIIHYADLFFLSLSGTQDHTVSLNHPGYTVLGCVCVHKSKQTHAVSMWVTGDSKIK